MNAHITQRSVEAAKPSASGYRVLFDDKIAGFGIRMAAAGAKSFVLNYRVGGEKRRHTVGTWPEWTADAARDEVTYKLLPAIHKGADPVRDKKALREEPTLADLSDEYIQQHAMMKKREKSVYEDRRMLDKIILPKLGTQRVSTVSKRLVQSLHNSLRKTPYQANRYCSPLHVLRPIFVDLPVIQVQALTLSLHCILWQRRNQEEDSHCEEPVCRADCGRIPVRANERATWQRSSASQQTRDDP